MDKYHEIIGNNFKVQIGYKITLWEFNAIKKFVADMEASLMEHLSKTRTDKPPKDWVYPTDKIKNCISEKARQIIQCDHHGCEKYVVVGDPEPVKGFFFIYGNIMAGPDGGLIGNNFDGEELVRVSCYCEKHFMEAVMPALLKFSKDHYLKNHEDWEWEPEVCGFVKKKTAKDIF